MRHRLKGRKLSRKTQHRIAMLRNLARPLVTFGKITTTLQRAKETSRFVEKLITVAKRAHKAAAGLKDEKQKKARIVHAIRLIFSVLRSHNLARKVVNDLAKRFENTPGGYTRIIKLGAFRWAGKGYGDVAFNRLGDNGQKVILQFTQLKDRKEEMKSAMVGKEYRREAEVEKAAAAAAKEKGKPKETNAK